MRPADLESRHVHHRTPSFCLFFQAASCLLLPDRKDPDDPCRYPYRKMQVLLHPSVQRFRGALQTFRRSSEQLKVIHVSDAACHKRGEPASSCLSDRPGESDRIGHREVEKPCVYVPSDDQVPSRSYLPEIFQKPQQVFRLWDLFPDEICQDCVHSCRIRVGHIRLLRVPDPETLLPQVFVHLLLEARLSTFRDRRVLCMCDPRVEQRIQCELRGMAEQLVQDAQQGYVPHLSRYPVASLLDLDRDHIFRFLSPEDPVHHIFQIQRYGLDRFDLRSGVSCQIRDPDLCSRDPGIFLYE